MSGAKTKLRELRAQRRPGRRRCWDHLVIAPLWVAYDANLGTLLRTCDAIGSCLAYPGPSTTEGRSTRETRSEHTGPASIG